MTHYFKFACIALLCLLFFVVDQVLAQSPQRDLLRQLSGMSDEEVNEFLHNSMEVREYRSQSDFQASLYEMTRRGMTEKLENAMSKDGSLELLTALRRSEKRKDPLSIQLSIDTKVEIKCSPLDLPKIKCTIENVDEEKEEVDFQFGGNYRSGKQTRFRVEMRDSAGVLLPPKKRYGVINGGGISRSGHLAFGEKWETVVDLQSFVSFPTPGRYVCEIIYSDQNQISELEDVTGLILSKSRKFEIEISKIQIIIRDSEKAELLKLLKSLDAKQTLKVLSGTYGKGAHKFIPLESPAGGILSKGLSAVPVLIERLEEETSPDMRAWLFSLLYSCTGQLDPRYFPGGEVLGDYDYMEGSWAIFGGKPGEGSSGGFGFSGVGKTRGVWSPIQKNEKAQLKLVKQWSKFKQYLSVVQEK